jgi:hypothetical protein
MSTATERSEILTPVSVRWEEFCDLLDKALCRYGCDNDSGPRVHRHARRVMTKMGGIDIPVTLKFFESQGGYCDCEILLNVDPWQILQ